MYKTVAGHGIAEHVDKKSRFIGQAWPVESEESARAIIEETRKKYWDASHHVFAFRLENDMQRFSDDGEPSGTAGKPLLEVILGNDVRNVLVVVTRYFGGTLLGTGGLVRAYTKGAQIALEAAEIIAIRTYARCTIRMDYGYLSKMQYLIQQKGYQTEGTEYGADVALHLLVPEEEAESFQKEVVAASEGRLTVQIDGTVQR